jgi:hypothetical protein
MLLKLPLDILLEVLAYLNPDQLSKLSRASKCLYSLLVPMIYRHVSLAMDNVSPDESFIPLSPQRMRMIRFTQRLLQKPYMAKYVRSLHVYFNHYHSEVPVPGPFSTEVDEDIIRAVRRTEADLDLWLAQLHLGGEDA